MIGKSLVAAAFLIAGLGACARPTYQPSKAVLYAAYQSDDVVQNMVLGRMVPLSDGDPGAIHEALSTPQTQFFDPTGVTYFVDSPANPFSNDVERKNATLGLASTFSGSCSGALGLNFRNDTISNANIQVQRQAYVDTSKRRYTQELASCCTSPDASCMQWVVTSAYTSKVDFDIKASQEVGLGGDFACSKNTLIGPSSSQPPVTAPVSPPAPGGGGMSAAPVAADRPLVATNSVGAAIVASFDSSDKHSAHISSTGWNLVEVLPRDQVCLEWKRACSIAGTAALRQQYACPGLIQK
jgi:hypothetical protein